MIVLKQSNNCRLLITPFKRSTQKLLKVYSLFIVLEYYKYCIVIITNTLPSLVSCMLLGRVGCEARGVGKYVSPAGRVGCEARGVGKYVSPAGLELFNCDNL
ncbi:hypothetical protein QVD17_31613 [Tagetes erecta]|uniref:Uncharacterized protein n=1 Tax=Tagetes erecta TaxID=13708 RepID=A0AAD8KA55_TARER|nr:hypothetical protein QVD17_31613 [Tagetes erecta]